jgi:hypothetical protein
MEAFFGMPLSFKAALKVFCRLVVEMGPSLAGEGNSQAPERLALW